MGSMCIFGGSMHNLCKADQSFENIGVWNKDLASEDLARSKLFDTLGVKSLMKDVCIQEVVQVIIAVYKTNDDWTHFKCAWRSDGFKVLRCCINNCEADPRVYSKLK